MTTVDSFLVGSRVKVTRPEGKRCPSPGWNFEYPHSFLGTVVRHPWRSTNFNGKWVFVQFDPGFAEKFGHLKSWYCLPEWLQPEDGPW